MGGKHGIWTKIMNKSNYINMLAIVLAVFITLPAQAGWFSRDRDEDFKPYLLDGKQVQNAQWRTENWTAEDWGPTPQACAEQVHAFFRAGVLVDYIKGSTWRRGSTPTLIVGPGFYHLSGFDQRRVLDVFNRLYNVTDAAKEKRSTVLSLKDWHTGRIIGIYTQAGLQLS